jgi:hypothetical protein
MVSVLLLFRWRKRPHWTWLLASGGVLGLAMQTKLNAFLIVPALLVEMLLAVRQKREPGCTRKFAVSMLIWFAGCGFIFAIITLVWGRGSFQSSYRAHFTAHLVPGLERPQDFPFQIPVLLNHAECVIAAVVGIFMVFRQHRIREFDFPMVMLVTASVIHAVHRPWWMYYYLHLAIPMAWLAGFAVAEILHRLSKTFAKTGLNLSLRKTWQALALCTLTALAVVRSERRLESGVKDLRERTRIAADPIIAKMKEFAPQTHWAYVQYGNEIYPFQAQLPMPPELALVTLKRFWSDQITEEKIVEICKRYQVEQLLLPRMHSALWNELLQDYTPVSDNGSLVLYASNSLITK